MTCGSLHRCLEPGQTCDVCGHAENIVLARLIAGIPVGDLTDADFAAMVADDAFDDALEADDDVV